MIEFVSQDTLEAFTGNPIIGQHRLRYESIIERQGWELPVHEHLEFDQYDNLATKYIIYRDANGVVRGSSRFYPTTRPYMLQEHFPQFVSYMDMPSSPNIWEGSRFCIDKNLPAPTRKRVAQELVLAFLEAGIDHNITAIIGMMYPVYLNNLFIKNGWEIEYMGDTIRTKEGRKTRAAWLPVSETVLQAVRQTTGITKRVINYGTNDKKLQAA